MNRDDRNRIMIQTRQFLHVLNEQCDLLKSSLDAAADAEQEKFDNLPKSLSESEKGAQIESAIEQLQEALDIIEEIQSLTESLPDTLNLQIKQSRKKENIGADVAGSGILPDPNENRTERLQLVITPTLAATLRSASSTQKLSMNEIVNRILIHALCTHSK